MPNLANKTADVNVVAKLFQELDIGDEAVSYTHLTLPTKA